MHALRGTLCPSSAQARGAGLGPAGHPAAAPVARPYGGKKAAVWRSSGCATAPRVSARDPPQAPSASSNGDSAVSLLGLGEDLDFSPVQPVTVGEIAKPVQAELDRVNEEIRTVVGKRHPMLLAAADQIFGAGGKKIRPILALLTAQATQAAVGNSEITDRQRRLAMVIEMIHVASLVHDDVLDECDIRRGAATVNTMFGSKVAVLVGDFLFAQSSWYLANLDNLEVIKLISQVIADFADGEISQAASLYNMDMTLDKYIDKSFYKTASLIAASCRSAAALTGTDDAMKADMYAYGKHLGLAFQVVDDILDITQSAEQLGKPQGQDLASGNITAPIIYALQAPGGDELRELIEGRFDEPGSLERGIELVQDLGGIDAARALAREEGRKAVAALAGLPMTPAKESLVKTVDYVLDRLH
ncbi:unnamed protein product [Pedinophyceae sp. YPF-701]|nr:unnamed protein product [Pedinophyceae sp. YPF-701]